MSVSKIDLLNKQFSRSMLGYSRMEVDQFMLELAEVVGDAADAQKEMKRRIKRLEMTLKEYRQRDETLRDTLVSTQKMVDDLKVAASREARIIMDEARAKAEATVQKGYHRLAQIHEEIEGLKRQRSQFEIQLKGLVKSHLELLESNEADRDAVEEMESKLTYLKQAK